MMSRQCGHTGEFVDELTTEFHEFHEFQNLSVGWWEGSDLGICKLCAEVGFIEGEDDEDEEEEEKEGYVLFGPLRPR